MHQAAAGVPLLQLAKLEVIVLCQAMVLLTLLVGHHAVMAGEHAAAGSPAALATPGVGQGESAESHADDSPPALTEHCPSGLAHRSPDSAPSPLQSAATSFGTPVDLALAPAGGQPDTHPVAANTRRQALLQVFLD